MILRYHRKPVTFDEVRQAIYEDRTGAANAAHVINAAERFRLRGRGLFVEAPMLLARIPTPNIAHMMPDRGQFPRPLDKALNGYLRSSPRPRRIASAGSIRTWGRSMMSPPSSSSSRQASSSCSTRPTPCRARGSGRLQATGRSACVAVERHELDAVPRRERRCPTAARRCRTLEVVASAGAAISDLHKLGDLRELNPPIAAGRRARAL